MTRYYTLRQLYGHHLQQLKCIAVFCCLVVPLFLFIVWIRWYSEAFFQVSLLLTGWLTWTFIEYILHRFYMHRKDSEATNALMQIHHHHHTHPTEIKVTGLQRLLMGIILIILVFCSYYWQNYFTLLTGFCFGIVGYFTMHKVIHQAWAAKVFRRLFRYHIYHHCKYPNTCFGISLPWWDDLFCTVPVNPQITDRIVAFYLRGHS